MKMSAVSTCTRLLREGTEPSISAPVLSDIYPVSRRMSVSTIETYATTFGRVKRISADCSSAEWIGRNRTSAPFRETTVRNSVLYRSVTIHTLYRFTLRFRYCVVHGETGRIRPSCFYTAFGCSGRPFSVCKGCAGMVCLT